MSQARRREQYIREAANQRLLALLDPALAELRRILKKPSTSDSDRLRAMPCYAMP
ncbi:MAG: hypothetical protein M3P96_02820 [Actinomycetota bacterium]|nr:hypothetical protein [Actinomycetota bacterium]